MPAGEPVDATATADAERSRFAPEIYRCAPVTGSYLFVVLFAGKSAVQMDDGSSFDQ